MEGPPPPGSVTPSRSFEGWLESAEKRKEEARALAAREAEQRKKQAADRAAEQEVRQRVWTVRKNYHDKALEALGKLKQERAESEDLWKDVVLALAAVQVILDSEGIKDSADITDAAEKKDSLLYSSLLLWTKRQHKFYDVPLTAKHVAQVSAREKANLVVENGNYSKSALGFMFPPPPAGAGLIPKVLNNDEKLNNALFVSIVKQQWRRAKADAIRHATGGSTAEGSSDGVVESKSSEPGADSDSKSAPGTPRTAISGPTTVTSLSPKQRQALTQLGLFKLLEWVTADADAVSDAAAASAETAKQRSKAVHAEWAKQKDQLRIVLAPGDAEPPKAVANVWKPPPRFDFSKKGVVRPKSAHFPSNSLEMMAATGTVPKVVYARPGKGGNTFEDLEASRKALLERGVVLRQNFADPMLGALEEEQEEAYRKEREAQAERVRKEREELEKQQARFRQWQASKVIRDKAVDALRFIEIPQGDTQQAAAARKDLWKKVGAALKGIDRTLFAEWQRWSEAFPDLLSSCIPEWDAFSPICCDTHVPSSSIRDVLLRLLHHKSVDYKQMFTEFCEEAKQEAKRNRDSDFSKDGLGPNSFRQFMLRVGIPLQPNEVAQVLKVFDQNDDGKITMNEFLNFVASDRKTPGDTEEKLASVCVWDKACHECGMPAAYDLVPDRASASGGGRVVSTRKSLPDHDKVSRQSFHKGAPKPEKCEGATWSNEQRQASLQILLDLSRTKRQEEAVLARLSEGKVPSVPTFRRRTVSSSEAKVDLTTAVCMEWEPGSKEDDVLFYVLETCGAEGTRTQKRAEWNQVVVDPPQAAPGTAPAEMYIHQGLKPEISYHYRLRAFNAHGGSGYAFAVFTTAPTQPVPPVVLRVSDNMATLCWQPSLEFSRRMRELEQVFKENDTDGSGGLSRDELRVGLKSNRMLREFLVRVHGDVGQETLVDTLFDAIETNDDGKLAWEEFRNFFQNRGGLGDATPEPAAPAAAPTPKAARPSTGSVSGRSEDGANRSRAGSVSSLSTSAGASFAGRAVVPTKFILEQCMHEPHDLSAEPSEFEWRKVYEGLHPSKELHGLIPGTVYKFRVTAVNGDGISSEPGLPAVVTTYLSTPAPPKLVGLATGTVKLRWDEADLIRRPAAGSAATTNASDEALMTAWAQYPGARDDSSAAGVGVSLKRAFDMYDKDGSGMIDAGEFVGMVRDLGLNLKGWRLEQAFKVLDTDNSGQISYAEFERWWKASHVTYVLKRDNGRPADSATYTDDESSATVVAYRGDSLGCVITGLEPNRVYRFFLRHITSSASSALSPALEVVTKPMAPSAPVTVYVTPRTASVKWYPAAAHSSVKYIVEGYPVQATLASTRSATRRSGASATTTTTSVAEPWAKMYEGKSCIATLSDLTPNATYRIRVFAMAEGRVLSDPSDMAEVCTADPAYFRPLSVSNTEGFTIDCITNRDVVVGDIILFTEDVFVSLAEPTMLDVRSVRLPAETSGRDGVLLCQRTIAAEVFAEEREAKSATAASMGSTGRSATGAPSTPSVVALSLDGSSVASSSADHGKRRHRLLGMSVIFSTVSETRGTPYILPPAKKIWRKRTAVLDAGVVRLRWVDEDRRMSAEREAQAGLR